MHSFIYSVVACDSLEWLVFSLFLQLLHQWPCSILWCLPWTHLCHPNRQCCHLCLGDWSYHQAHTKQTWPHQWKNELKNCHHTVHHNCRYHVPLWSDMALWCTNCHWNQRHYSFYCLPSSLCDLQRFSGFLHLLFPLRVQQRCPRFMVRAALMWPLSIKIIAVITGQVYASWWQRYFTED